MLTTTVITPELLDQSMTYTQYRNLLDELMAENKTTGPNQEESLIAYAKLNNQRMKRLDKTIKLGDELNAAIAALKEGIICLVITEGWCGDAAQNIPLSAAMEAVSDKIELKLILRDEHLEVMDEYLTNGSRSIPKMIFLKKESLTELATWGPRPQTAQNMVLKAKEDPNLTKEEFTEQVHAWYAKDKTKSMQAEMTSLLLSIN